MVGRSATVMGWTGSTNPYGILHSWAFELPNQGMVQPVIILFSIHLLKFARVCVNILNLPNLQSRDVGELSLWGPGQIFRDIFTQELEAIDSLHHGSIAEDMFMDPWRSPPETWFRVSTQNLFYPFASTDPAWPDVFLQLLVFFISPLPVSWFLASFLSILAHLPSWLLWVTLLNVTWHTLSPVSVRETWTDLPRITETQSNDTKVAMLYSVQHLHKI